ncbi:MAG: hypothetical protein RR630_00595 [Coprobacillus sp.]
MKLKKLNNCGSALQIVLVIFVVMTFALTSCLVLMKTMSANSLKIEHIMKQKNLEIMLVSYYIDQLENDILLSDSYSNQNTKIEYSVDVISTYYEILTDISFDNCQYQLLMQVDLDTREVLKIEYKEG